MAGVSAVTGDGKLCHKGMESSIFDVNLAIKNCEAFKLLIVSQHSTLATLAMASVYFAQNPNDSAEAKCNQGTIIYFGTIINTTTYKS